MLVKAIEDKTVIPLKDFIAALRAPEEKIDIAYAQAWGLYHYLDRYKSASVDKYFLQLAAPAPAPGSEEKKNGDKGAAADVDVPPKPRPAPDAEKLTRIFIDCFGPIDTLEEMFLRHYRKPPGQ